MPERINVRTYNTEDVQGPESWIKLRSMTVGEVLESQRQIELRDNVWYKIGGFLGRLLRRRPPQSELSRRSVASMIQYVRDWNWVDDQGEPLPLPVDDARVLERLTYIEVGVLSACIRGERQNEEQKN